MITISVLQIETAARDKRIRVAKKLWRCSRRKYFTARLSRTQLQEKQVHHLLQEMKLVNPAFTLARGAEVSCPLHDTSTEKARAHTRTFGYVLLSH